MIYKNPDSNLTTIFYPKGLRKEDIQDPAFIKAGRMVCYKQTATIGMLQRYMRIGFLRAEDLIHRLEAAGVLKPEPDNRPREVLMVSWQFEKYLEQHHVYADSLEKTISSVTAKFPYWLDL